MRILPAAIASLAGLLAAGCAPCEGDILRGLQSDDPAKRIEAIVAAGETDCQLAVPLLVERLDDSQRDVRLFASVALKKITGESMGWHYYDSPQKQAEALARWRAWLRSRSETRPAGES